MLKDLDLKDIAKRLYAFYPRSWSPEPTWDDAPDVAIEDQISPNLKATFEMLAAGWKSSATSTTGFYDLLTYTENQTRINTATGFWLDLCAQDFSGGTITRHLNESDDKFRRRLQIEILRPKGTRCALECGVANLTGYPAKVIEVMNPNDCGCYAPADGIVIYTTLSATTHNSLTLIVADTAGIVAGMTVSGSGITEMTAVLTVGDQTHLSVSRPVTMLRGTVIVFQELIGTSGYGVAGAYASLTTPFQLFVTATRPLGAGIPLVNGYSMSSSGYSTIANLPWGYIGSNFPPNYGTGQYCAFDEIGGDVTDEDIYQNVAESMPAGTIAWTRIIDPMPEQPNLFGGGLLDANFYLDYTALGSDQGSIHTTVSVSLIIPFLFSGGINRNQITGSIVVFQPSSTGSLTQVGSLVAKTTIPFVWTAVMSVNFGITVLAIKSSAQILQTGFISQNFVLGSSLLLPPGGLLDKTWVLDNSILDKNYGY